MNPVTAPRSTPLWLALPLALPWLLARPATPDAVLYNQLAALAAWGLWLLAAPAAAPRWRRLWPALAALACCGAWATAAGAGSAALVLLAAAAVLAAASGAAATTQVGPVATAFWLAGLGSAAVATVQYAAPSLTDGWLVAAGGSAGRAVGNLRQPNHLATALMLAMVATAWLWQAGRLRAAVAGASLALMLLALAMSASRTGALALGVLLAWAALDGRLPRAARWALAATPLAYGLAWAALAGMASVAGAQFYGSDRLAGAADISSSRFAIWRNGVDLVAAQPWGGVGWGQFNAAWTFSAFPDRPLAFFDHTHNLPLHLAVEMGLPATAAVLGLLGWALWRARSAWGASAPHDAAPAARAALAMLAVLGLHSLLEYPLWYSYFLLPGAWALGAWLGAAAPGPGRDAVRPGWAAGRRLLGGLMIAGAAFAAWEQQSIEAIFAPPAGAGPLAGRIAEGRKSRLFGHHADYAAVTTEPRDQRLASFARPLRQLVDTRLLIAYIEALRAHGRDAEALVAAQRLREFRRPEAQAYFKDCTAENPAPPFQCSTREAALTWREVMP